LADARLILAEAARGYAHEVLVRAGFCAEDASACADLLTESSLRGVDSHGVVALLPVFANQARHGVGAESAKPATAERRGATAVLDAGRASGPRAARAALAEAVHLARAHGVGTVVARRMGYFGALFWSVLPAAEDGLIALATVNAMAFVAPAGGREALHGTNPIAVAIPHDPDPIVVDMRTNAFRMGDFWEGVRTGAPLPGDALIRPDGTSLTDVAELEAGGWDSAVSLPAAGAKGYGLALVADVLTAALAGSPIGRELAWENEREELAAFFLALDPGFFGPPDRFAAVVTRLAEQVHATAPLDPAAPVRLPGERAAWERRRRLAEGIPVDPALWARMEERLGAVGIELPQPDFTGPLGAS
jgi:LDH2 family malate/lactate/ureidoglycolate dehydrogenase